MEDNQVSLDKTPQPAPRGKIAIVAGAVTVAVGIGLALWQPWVDRTPFTAYEVAVQDAEYTTPGSTPGTCVRTSASEEERVIFDEDGTRLASARDPREGEVLGPEFGEFAGACLFVSRIDGVPGGRGTYVTQWAGGTKSTMSEEDLRESPEDQRERVKTWKRKNFRPAED
ncbi:hypothetical protein AW27_023280 [Streptomyces sp. PCS3-D2]|uniref:hypothetical protein n=1 Tax=Streptomyces sp. PCS3-D2 TaxID=1460244 RepID=UPI000AE751EE|nr:hypothetical protein [Streptomyces sp. PCS3-D2]WKV74168.1 hypothetical protein AW27_023280 [Streptomyces sp. PCS3-D2]